MFDSWFLKSQHAMNVFSRKVIVIGNKNKVGVKREMHYNFCCCKCFAKKTKVWMNTTYLSFALFWWYISIICQQQKNSCRHSQLSRLLSGLFNVLLTMVLQQDGIFWPDKFFFTFWLFSPNFPMPTTNLSPMCLTPVLACDWPQGARP